MFICSMDDPDAAIVGLTENPADRVASALLEDVGDWLDAIKELKRTEVPAGVISTLHALHEAVCGWVDWDARTEKR